MLVTNPNVTDGKETISVTDGTGYTDTLKPCNLLYKDVQKSRLLDTLFSFTFQPGLRYT